MHLQIKITVSEKFDGTHDQFAIDHDSVSTFSLKVQHVHMMDNFDKLNVLNFF